MMVSSAPPFHASPHNTSHRKPFPSFSFQDRAASTPIPCTMPSKLAPLLVLLALPLLAFAAPPPCDASRAPAAFCDITRSPIARARALVATLTMGEKVDQTGAGAHGIDRLGIPPFQWWGEALHGVCESPNVHFRAPTPNATSFPEIIGVASSFDAGLFGAMGIAIGREARAMMNAGNANGTFWAPNINIVKVGDANGVGWG